MQNPVELILAKREGKTLSPADIAAFITGFLEGSIPEYQMSALLMAIFFQGLNPEEIAALTQSYIRSGQTIAFPAELIVADKHSTGGVGDKISLMLAPIAASLGLSVPMISGRASATPAEPWTSWNPSPDSAPNTARTNSRPWWKNTAAPSWASPRNWCPPTSGSTPCAT